MSRFAKNLTNLFKSYKSIIAAIKSIWKYICWICKDLYDFCPKETLYIYMCAKL